MGWHSKFITPQRDLTSCVGQPIKCCRCDRNRKPFNGSHQAALRRVRRFCRCYVFAATLLYVLHFCSYVSVLHKALAINDFRALLRFWLHFCISQPLAGEKDSRVSSHPSSRVRTKESSPATGSTRVIRGADPPLSTFHLFPPASTFFHLGRPNSRVNSTNLDQS
jgi:hypothetical protein